MEIYECDMMMGKEGRKYPMVSAGMECELCFFLVSYSSAPILVAFGRFGMCLYIHLHDSQDFLSTSSEFKLI